MSVVGIDFGNAKTVIAVARNRGIDIITNEVSNRATPSLVAFGPKCRYLGESAKTQEISNLKNTVGSLKRLLGRSANDPDTQIEKQYVGAELIDMNGQVGTKVNYLGQETHFTATQLVAAYLSKIRQTTSNELKTPATDCVLSVPVWFTDIQRRHLVDAAQIAGLNPLRIINDTTAAALGYGITKTDLPEDKPRHVCFVDIGHSSYTVSVVAFQKGQLAVKGTAYDRHFGGRNFDKALTDHFAEQFIGKYKIDVKSNPKAHFRVLTGAEKAKKILSANAQAPLSIESVMNDVDVSTMIKREEMEQLVQPLLDRVQDPLKEALAQAGLQISDIDSIEMIGGCTRVPAVKERIQNFFGKPLSYTLNQDEAVAAGCTFACAVLSPAFRVRDFTVLDRITYPVEFQWEPAPDIPDEETSLEVFPQNNLLPSTKILTFYRKQPFDLEVRYSQPERLPGSTNPWVARYSIKNVTPDSNNDFSIVKVKARVNLFGMVNVEAAYIVEEQEVEEVIPEKKNEDKKKADGKDDQDKMEVDGTESGASTPVPPKTRKVKKLVRKAELPIMAATSAHDLKVKESFTERENQMSVEDKLVADTEDRKNSLEEYIYDIRGKLDDLYANFASESEKEKFRAKLNDTEEWLYNDGEDATKAVYVAKFEELMSLGGPIRMRFLEAEEAKRQAQLKAREEKEAAEKAAREAEEAEKRKANGEDAEMPNGEQQPSVEEPAEEGQRGKHDTAMDDVD